MQWAAVQLPFLCRRERFRRRPSHALSKNFDSLCLQRIKSSLASSRARTRSRAMLAFVVGARPRRRFPRRASWRGTRRRCGRFPLAVGRGLDHLRNRADDAVDAQRRELLLQVESGDAGLVDALRGRVEGSHPLCDGRRVVGECGRADLAGHRVEGDGPLSSARARRGRRRW